MYYLHLLHSKWVEHFSLFLDNWFKETLNDMTCFAVSYSLSKSPCFAFVWLKMDKTTRKLQAASCILCTWCVVVHLYARRTSKTWLSTDKLLSFYWKMNQKIVDVNYHTVCFVYLLYSPWYILWMQCSSACFRWPELCTSTWMHHSFTDTEKQLGLLCFFFSFLLFLSDDVKPSVLKNEDMWNHIFTSNSEHTLVPQKINYHLIHSL